MKLRRPTKDCPTCKNMIGKLGEARRHYYVRCEHKGRAYIVNGGYVLILCICCTRKLLKRGIAVKEWLA